MTFTPLLVKMIIKGIRSFSSSIHVNDPYILSGARTPIGSFLGKLNSLSCIQLGSKALEAAVERSKLPKEEVAELVLGCVYEAGLGQSPARQVSVSSGLPTSVVTTSVNALCSSGLKAVIFASQIILAKTHEVVAAGGVESMSNAGYVLMRKGPKFGNLTLIDTIPHDALIDVIEKVDVTTHAESAAKKYNFTREVQDEYALKSYAKAAAAQREGFFSSEMIPVVVEKKGTKGEIICEDEEIGRLNVEKFKSLIPDMGKGGTITVGNSSGLCDGAAAVILTSGNYVLKNNLQPMARIVSFAECSVDTKDFCSAPAIAIQQALQRAKLNAEDISMWEISETFAITPMLNADILKLNTDRLNVHGGAISLGHPFGMTGTRLTVHLAHVLKSGEIGCAAISCGGGGGSAIVIEKM